MIKTAKLFIFVALSLVSLPMAAQDGGVFKRSTVVKTFRSLMKDKKYDKAKEAIDQALAKYEEARDDAQFYCCEVEALNELVGQENTKIYLQNKPDTLKFFQYIYTLYEMGLRCDSLEQRDVEATQAAGKKAEPKLRRTVGELMLPYRANLLNAGKFYYKRRDYAKAYQFFDMYVKTKTSPVFIDKKGEQTVSDPDNTVSVSVLAVLSAYATENHDGVMRYLTASLNDKELEPQLTEMGSKSAATLGDTVEMVRLLEQGFERYPKTEYFLLTLTRHYNEHGEYDKALEKALRMTRLQPEERDYWYMAGKEQMLMDKYEDALSSFQHCVNIKADDAESYSAIGNIYLRDAQEAYAQFNLPLSDPAYEEGKENIRKLYQKACDAFEQARKYDESKHDLWLPGLRETYFKLNKGKALKALERYK